MTESKVTANKHTINELRCMQAYPLEMKVALTKKRITEWANYWGLEACDVSFSGGKDSTVLLHICRELYPEMKAVFADTGLELPEIREFVKTVPDVDWVRPQKNFRQVLTEFGYPMISKDVSRTIRYYRQHSEWAIARFEGRLNKRYGGGISQYRQSRYAKWKKLADEAPFRISDRCCEWSKEKPLEEYSKQHGTHQIVALLAEESERREQAWLKTGCNAFADKGLSKPMSFWTEQDILHYIKANNLPIASAYGEIVAANADILGQLTFLDDEQCPLCTTGEHRTGCCYCLFGAHLDKGETRLQRLHSKHPKLYDYVMGGGEFDSEGMWIPNAKGLGYKFVMDETNRIMGKTLYRY